MESTEENRNIAVIHQILCLTQIDFTNELIYGYTELTLASLTDEEIHIINLNCKQCKIYCCVFNGTTDAEFDYSDPSLLKPGKDENKRDLQSLLYQDELGRISVSADAGNGEIEITIPETIREKLKQKFNIKLAREFCVEKPKGGIRFILNRGFENNDPTNNYLYTIENSSNFWFPCVQSYNELLTWKLEVTVDADLFVIASGTLIEVENVIPSEDHVDNMKNLKKFHYFLSHPTSAPNIGLVIGKFESLIDENIAEVSYYCEPELVSLLKPSTSFLHEVFEFYEELLGSHFPCQTHKIVFVYDLHEEAFSYSTLSIVNLTYLHSKSIIEQTISTRRLLANLVAKQFFTHFISMFDWCNWWLLTGIASFLTSLYIKKVFGKNEYKSLVYSDMKEICTYEREHGYVLLDLDSTEFNGKDNLFKCNSILKNPLLAPICYVRIAEKKASFVMRLIDDCIGRDIMSQVWRYKLII